MVGSSARPLQVASHGVARASHLPRGGDHVGKAGWETSPVSSEDQDCRSVTLMYTKRYTVLANIQ